MFVAAPPPPFVQDNTFEKNSYFSPKVTSRAVGLKMQTWKFKHSHKMLR